MEILLSGLVLGLFTSLHCAGMCGPIAVALPLHGETIGRKLFGGVLYNLGRTVTYVSLGAVLGLLGQGINALGLQSWLSVITGVLMIATVAFPSLFRFDLGNSGGFRLINKLKRALGRLFSTKSFVSLFSIGILNGFLPCGPLYVALIASTAAGSMAQSMLFMLMFGLGTIPMLLFISILGNLLSHSLRKKLSNFLPVVIVIIGLLFILRGLNLGIPYLSPKTEKIEKKMEMKQKEMEGKEINLKHIEEEVESGKSSNCCGS